MKIKKNTPAVITNDKEYLRDFFDHAPVGFHVFGPNRKFMDINQAELDMIGYAYDEIIGKKSWSDLIIAQEKPLFEQQWNDLCREGKALNLYYTLVHKDGHHVRVLLNATAKLDKAGNIVHTRGSVLDITEKEAGEESLKRLALELSQQKQVLEQKNSALRELIAQIEIEKNHIKDKVMANVEKLILPILTKLRRRSGEIDRQHIGLLEDNLKQLTSSFGRAIGEHQWRLTPKEIEICDMVKNGLSTKEIASMLSSSCRTVDNHRNRIRKKLNITQKDINLSSYLLSLNRKSP